MEAVMADTKEKKTKKRIFYPGRAYIVDEENYIINQDKDMETLAQNYETYMPTDTVLVAFHVSELKQFVKKVIDKVVFNFEANTLTVTGDAGGYIRMNMVDYEVGVHDIEEEELKTWQKMVADAKASAKTVEVVGRPPIAGTYLEYDRDV